MKVLYLVNVAVSLGIGSSEYGTASIKLTDEAGLGHADSLLFHGFMNAGLVVLTNAVELINTAQTAVSQHQSTCL